MKKKEDIKELNNIKKYPFGIIYHIQEKEVSRYRYIKFCEEMNSQWDWIKPKKEYKFKEKELKYVF